MEDQFMNASSQSDSSVSFFTNCYEGDWEQVLMGDRLQQMIENCKVDFKERILIINNVNDRARVEEYALKALNNKVIDAYYFAEDYSDKILNALSVTRGSFWLDFHDGYWYSMGPMAAIYFCKSRYLLYFTCDCMIPPNNTSDWITKAMGLFEKDDSLFVANPNWDTTRDEARTESMKEDDEWYYGYGFSDQCFFVENSRLRQDIYNYYHFLSERFPFYGGKPFERRIDSYMRCKGLLRITNKHIHYTHEKLLNSNINATPKKETFKKKIKRTAGHYSRKVRRNITTFLKKHD